MALDEEFEYLCKLLLNNWNESLFFILFLAFRCAYCNYFNSARKNKPVFNPNLFSPIQIQNGTTNIERMDMSVTDSSDSNESRVTRRSIRVPTTNNNEIQSRSISVENKRQIYPSLEENLSDKNK